MSDQEKTPSWKSFLYAIGGAYCVFCSILLHDNKHFENSSLIVMAIWGISFWVSGTGNLFVDRRVARNQNRVP